MAASGKDRDYDFVQPLPEELTCSICMKVLCEPHLVNCCEQQYCKGCLDKWRKKNKTCPHCRSTDFSSMLLKQTCRKVGELKVYCSNKRHGCKAELKISEYESHLSTTNDKGCSYVQLDCPNDCKAKEFRGAMETHTQKKCPKRVVCCKLCKLKGEYQAIAGEHVNKCPSYPLPCPLGCGAELIRKDLESHRSTCPLEPVLCPFSGLGCKTKVCRKDLDKHIESSTLQHMTVLAESHTALQMKVQAIASVLKNASSMNSSQQIAHIYTILTDTSTLKIGDTIQLALSESPGHHYIIVSQEPQKQISHKFKLEWEARAPTRQQQVYMQPPRTITFKLYSIHEAGYSAITAETKFDFLLDRNYTMPVCLEKQKPQEEFGVTPQLIKTIDLDCPHQQPTTITINPHKPCRVCSPTHFCICCGRQCSSRTWNHSCQWCGSTCKKK